MFINFRDVYGIGHIKLPTLYKNAYSEYRRSINDLCDT